MHEAENMHTFKNHFDIIYNFENEIDSIINQGEECLKKAINILYSYFETNNEYDDESFNNQLFNLVCDNAKDEPSGIFNNIKKILENPNILGLRIYQMIQHLIEYKLYCNVSNNNQALNKKNKKRLEKAISPFYSTDNKLILDKIINKYLNTLNTKQFLEVVQVLEIIASDEQYTSSIKYLIENPNLDLINFINFSSKYHFYSSLNDIIYNFKYAELKDHEDIIIFFQFIIRLKYSMVSKIIFELLAKGCII